MASSKVTPGATRTVKPDCKRRSETGVLRVVPHAVHLLQLPGTAGMLASSFADFAFAHLRAVLSASAS